MRPFIVFLILFSISGHLPLYSQMRLYPLEHAGAIVPGSTVTVRWAKPGDGWRYDVFVEGLQGQEQKIAENITDTLLSYVVPPGFSDKIKFRVAGHGERGLVFGPNVEEWSPSLFTLCTDRTLHRTGDGLLMIRDGVFGPTIATINHAVFSGSLEPRLSCSPNGRFVAVTRGNGEVLLFNSTTEQLLDSALIEESPFGKARTIQHRVSNDGMRYYFCKEINDTTSTLNVFDFRTRSVTRSITVHGGLEAVMIHPRTSWLSLYGYDFGVKVYDTESLEELDPEFRPTDGRWIRNGTTMMCRAENDSLVLHDYSTRSNFLKIYRRRRTSTQGPLVSETGLIMCHAFESDPNPPYKWILVRTDLVSGNDIDSVPISFSDYSRLYISDDGSMVVCADESGWSYYLGGGSLTRVTLKEHQTGSMLFSGDLRFCRIFTKTGIVNVDVLTGRQRTDTLDAGSFPIRDNVSFRNDEGHIGLYPGYTQGYRVVKNSDPFSYRSMPLTAEVSSFGASARIDLLPIVTNDSVLSIINVLTGAATYSLRIPFSAARVIDMSKDGRSTYLGDRWTIISIRLNTERIDTVFSVGQDESILGGVYDAERDELIVLAGNSADKASRLIAIQSTGAVFRSDSVLRTISSVVNDPVSFHIVNGESSILVAKPGTGFAYVDRSTSKPRLIVNDRSFDVLLDCNDSLGLLAYKDKLAVIDHRTGVIQSLRDYSGNRFIRSAAFSQQGSRVTLFEWASGAHPPYTLKTRSMLLHFDMYKRQVIDSMELPTRYNAGSITVMKDDCTMLVHSNADLTVRWNSCENKPWEGSVAGTVGAPTSVYSGAEDHPEMNKPVISLTNEVLSISFEGVPIDNVRLVDQIGRTIVYTSLSGNDSRADIDVGQLSSAMYFVCVNNRFTFPIVSVN